MSNPAPKVKPGKTIELGIRSECNRMWRETAGKHLPVIEVP
jgi:hypothetical protein